MNISVDFSKQPQSPAELCVHLDALVSKGLSETSALIMTDLNYQIKMRAEATAQAEYYERRCTQLTYLLNQKESELAREKENSAYLTDQVNKREDLLCLWPLALSRKEEEIESLTARLREDQANSAGISSSMTFAESLFKADGMMSD